MNIQRIYTNLDHQLSFFNFHYHRTFETLPQVAMSSSRPFVQSLTPLHLSWLGMQSFWSHMKISGPVQSLRVGGVFCCTSSGSETITQKKPRIRKWILPRKHDNSIPKFYSWRKNINFIPIISWLTFMITMRVYQTWTHKINMRNIFIQTVKMSPCIKVPLH